MRESLTATQSKGTQKWPWGLQFGYSTDRKFTDTLRATLNALTTNDRVTVVANLHVMTLDGEAAEISTTTEEYFDIVSQGLYSQSHLEKVEAGTILKMTPKYPKMEPLR